MAQEPAPRIAQCKRLVISQQGASRIQKRPFVLDRVTRAGETVNWFTLPSGALPSDIQTRLARIGIEICSASVYDEHWIVSDAHAGQQSEWREIKRCPPLKESENEF
jgi:hypothetical protein